MSNADDAGTQPTLHVDAGGKDSQLRLAAWVTLALTLGQTATWLLNVSLYPSFDSFFSWARDINQTWCGLISLVLVAVAMQWPRILTGKGTAAITLASLVCGYALAVAGSAVENPVLATIGTCVLGLASTLTTVYIGLSLVRLEPMACLGALLISSVAGYALMGALWLVPVQSKFVLLLVLRLTQLVIAIRLAQPILVQAAGAGVPADLSITNPLSFLPATHRLFIAILLFQTAYGYMITFGSANSYPQPILLASVLVVVVAVYALVRRRFSTDMFYGLAFVFVLAGLVVAAARGIQTATLGSFSLTALANVFISAGHDMYYIAIMFVLAAIGRRNVAEAVPVLLLNNVASCFGVGAGALIGLANNALIADDSPVANVLPLIGIFLFATYNFFLVRSFSFDRTVSELQPMEPLHKHKAAIAQTIMSPVAKPALIQAPVPTSMATPIESTIEISADPLAAICDDMAREYKLTPREAEVFEMLAHGRNVAYMQEVLTLSRNTIKTHVANVYGKLDVHSHQELIDLVEGRA